MQDEESFLMERMWPIFVQNSTSLDDF